MMNIRRKLDDTLSVTSSLGHIVSPLLYPSNSIKCVTEDKSHVFSRDVLTLLGNLDIEHPVGQYVCDVCRGFVEQYGTGGDQLLYFISSWTKAAQLLCDMGISSALVVHLLETAVEGCIGHAETLQITVREVLDRDTVSKTGEKGQEVDGKSYKETTNYEQQDEVSTKTMEASEAVVDVPQKKDRQADRQTTFFFEDTGNYKSRSKDFIEEINSGLKETDHKWISEPAMPKHFKESATNMRCQLKPRNDFLGSSDNHHSGQHADTRHESVMESALPTCHSQELNDEITPQIQGYTQSKNNLCQKESKLNTEDNPEEFIDGIKIVQLKMNNAEGRSDEIGEDISWFFSSEGSKPLNTDQTNCDENVVVETLDSADNITTVSPKQNDFGENNEKSDSTEVNLEQAVESTDTEDKYHSSLPDKVNGDFGCFDNVEGSNREAFDGYDSLKTELVALKSYIEMDIKRIKQGQKKLKKVSYSTKSSSDVYFDACFEDLDDEFDPCFDDSFPMKGNVKSLSNSKFGTKSSDDDFRTVQFTFEEQRKQSNNTIDKVTHDKDLCKQDQIVGQNNCLCDISSRQSDKHSSADNNIEDGDSIMPSDEEFDNCFDDRCKFDPNTLTSIGSNKQNYSGKVNSKSKPTDSANRHKDIAKTDKGPSHPSCKGKLQDIDTLLKRVGKDTKSSNYSASSVKISSRHMNGMRNECNFGTTSESTNAKEVNNVGSSNSNIAVSKATNKSQLQDIDTLLKGLGRKETKRKSYSASSLKIASRHLTSDEIENNAAASFLEPQVVAAKENEDTKGKIAEGKDKANSHTEIPSPETPLESVIVATSEERADSKYSEKAHHTLDTIDMNRINELLKGIKNVEGKTQKDQPKFKSNVFVRSRHFAADMVTEECHRNTVGNDIAVAKEGLTHGNNEEASNGSLVFNRLDSAGKKKIIDLVTDLNYGTDSRLVSVVAEAVEKQSQDKTLRLSPKFVQTYTITGGQGKPQLVEGVLLKTPHDQTEAVHKLAGRSCKLMIVNADITSSYKHKGYKPMKTTKVFTAELFSSHVTQRDQWALAVSDLLKTLAVDIVLARGSISEDFKLLCDDLGLVAMEFVPYRQLSIISDTARITMVTYITLATEENVCQNVQISPWIPGSGEDTKKCVSGTCQHVSIIRITGDNPQTVVLQNHSQPLVSLEEEAVRHCLHRTGSTLQSGLMLPGAGHTEMNCASYCLNMAEKHLKEPQRKGSCEESQYLATTYEVLARTLQEYSQQVQHHCALVCDKPSDCVYDDCTSKTEAWRTAVNTVCILLSSDFYIMTGLKDEQRVFNDFVIL